MSRGERLGKALWSIALPGFGQLLNGQLFKGLVFIGLGILIIIQSNLMTVIIYSFQGDIQSAIDHVNEQWLMFYPCTYIFSLWDAYRDAGGRQFAYSFLPFVFSAYSFLPFVFSAYFLTLGVIYSSSQKIFGVLFGPVFLPMLFLIPGIGIGLVLMIILGKMKM